MPTIPPLGTSPMNWEPRWLPPTPARGPWPGRDVAEGDDGDGETPGERGDDPHGCSLGYGHVRWWRRRHCRRIARGASWPGSVRSIVAGAPLTPRARRLRYRG